MFNVLVPRPKYSCKNSFELKKSLENLSIPDNHELVSLDAVSLFTNTITISHPSSHKNNLALVEKLLLETIYPIHFIQKYNGKNLAYLKIF